MPFQGTMMMYWYSNGNYLCSSCCGFVSFCYERAFVKSLFLENQAFNAISRYHDDSLNIDNIYPTVFQLNRANSSDTEAPFLDLNHCISYGTVSTNMCDKRDFYFYSISVFWMAMSPSVLRMGYTYLNLLNSPQLLQILVTLTAVIKR